MNANIINTTILNVLRQYEIYDKLTTNLKEGKTINNDLVNEVVHYTVAELKPYMNDFYEYAESSNLISLDDNDFNTFMTAVKKACVNEFKNFVNDNLKDYCQNQENVNNFALAYADEIESIILKTSLGINTYTKIA